MLRRLRAPGESAHTRRQLPLLPPHRLRRSLQAEGFCEQFRTLRQYQNRFADWLWTRQKPAAGGGVKDRPERPPTLEIVLRIGAKIQAGQRCSIASANFSIESVLSTSFRVSHALRACSTPKRIFSMCVVWCESVLMTIFTPCC